MAILDRLRDFRRDLSGDFIAAAEAERFAELMQAERPKEWQRWCRDIAVHHITIELVRFERKERRKALSAPRRFAEAAAGDVQDLSLFRVTFAVDDAHTRRPFGRMTGPDCHYAANAYRRSSTQSLMMAAFLEAVAKRVKNRTVAQVLTESQCQDILRKLGGNGDELLAA